MIWLIGVCVLAGVLLGIAGTVLWAWASWIKGYDVDILKPAFITPLHVEQVDERDWLVLDDFIYESLIVDRRITVMKNFVTDFASVPRLPFVYLLTGGIAVRAATIHDWCYRGGEDISRRNADAVFREVMKLTGHWWWRRWLMWAGLRLFGWASFRGFNHALSGKGNAAAKAEVIVETVAKDPAATIVEKVAAIEIAKEVKLAPPLPAPEAVESAKAPEAKHAEVK